MINSEKEITYANITVPDPESLAQPAAASATTTSAAEPPKPKPAKLNELKKKREDDLKIERELHKGYPVLKSGSLEKYVCNYAGCGKIFSCRDALFRHLRKMIDPERMVRNYHQDHFKLVVSDLSGMQRYVIVFSIVYLSHY